MCNADDLRGGREEIFLSDQVLRPAADWELRSMVAQLVEKQVPVEVIGNGTKRSIGRPTNAEASLSVGSLRGITLYEPTELVMSAAAGTPLSQIETELAARGQMLAFEPIDLAPALGGMAGEQSIGGVFATNASGARRIQVGAARDHLIGLSGVNGMADLFKSGGRVMKNVTGIDIARGLAGSWGTLAVVSEVTFKVMPWPQDVLTLAFPGLTEDIGNELLCSAMGLPFEISGAVHLPKALSERLELAKFNQVGDALTVIRLENTSTSITYRRGKVLDALKAYGAPIELALDESIAFWGELRRLSVMPANGSCLWRISTAPSKGSQVIDAIGKHMPVNAFYDWSGGLIWAEVPAAADGGSSDVRRAVAIHGGHATLIRAEPSVRAEVDVFQPLEPAVVRVKQGLKKAFDPYGILNVGRMYANL